MYIHVDHRWFKTFLKIDMKKLLSLLLIVFSCQFSFAGSDRDEYWLQRDIQIGDGRNTYGKKVYGSASRSVMEAVPIKGTTQTEVRELIKRSIAADKPTAAKVGKSMIKRIYSPQAIVGTAIVTALLEGIGWIMEDGVYVKKVSEEDDPPKEYGYALNGKGPDDIVCYSVSGCESYLSKNPVNGWKSSGSCSSGSNGGIINCPVQKDGSSNTQQFNRFLDPKYVPSEPKVKTVPLTAALLGAAMLGSQYTDPDPNFDNKRVNTGDYTGVKETYEHDPSGVGDELADDMDDKLKNAKPTDDSKPSWVGDPKYDNRPLGEDDKSSDRSWDDKGDEATGGTEPEKDPETGEATGNQSITIKFPLFCSWASKMCLWYDDWKASDKVYKDHMKKTEDHQGQEKTFWGSVKSWFDWTKENDDLDNDNEIPEIKQIDIGALDTSTFKGTPGCPTPIPVPVDFGSKGSIEVSYEPICQLASKWSFVAPLIGFLSGAMILVGVGRKGEDGEI